ncbi:hypothetical protein KGF57_000040 [Candida theae]|uniref:Rad4 beta-hairpin domain-containing protein n=1 Tax=Candida theae TaxID=1198502 RepID=A0AAD5G137_9ASCO|nr:uncharacterized protein KGF57_000040 [Candida theae]KAI5968925.1 hypothetical protein KGF57_000040 [Candida theae]
MSDLPTQHHKQLLKESDLDDNSNRRIKRRKKAPLEDVSRVHGVQEPPGDSEDSSDFEDVSLDAEGWESDDSDDFEEVSFSSPGPVNNIGRETPHNPDQLMTFKLDTSVKEPETKRKVKFISNEERVRRVLMHKMYIVLLLTHVAIRNSWCNNKSVSKSLKQACVTGQISQLLNDDKGSDSVKSRRFLDGIKKLMGIYAGKFRITSQGLVRKNWEELGVVQDSEIVTKKKFATLVTNFRGNRDIAAQGFVCLLRGLGLNARLVVSLQPPDHTIITENFTSKSKRKTDQNTKDRADLFKSKSSTTASKFEDSAYPIFWVEVWDKFAKHWVSVDPIVKKKIEICSKRRPSSFEPPPGDERNQLTYAVAFDKLGRVRDVTRRYSINYNARVIRKRIEFKSDNEKDWYDSVLKSCQKTQSKSIVDIFEAKEFHERDLAEGMPNNMQAFKNHPLYALESQLKQNEVIHPKDDSSVCGTFRPKSASAKLLPVYRRSCVQKLRSARAWYMRGRVLKIGATALKSKEKPGPEDEDVRLYAEYQTKLYIPPKIEDGIIPKNPYGNIDIYTDTMIPENATLVKTTEQYTIKRLQKAATLLGVDYATAITSFDFTQRSKGTPNAKEGGIVIHRDNKEALELTLHHMIQEDEEAKRVMVEMNALSNWKYFLLKLRLKQRLNRTHGTIGEEGDAALLENEHIAEGPLVHENNHVDDDNNASEDDFGGGFIVSDDEGTELVHEEDEVQSGNVLGESEIGRRERRSRRKHGYKELSDKDIDGDAEIESTKQRQKRVDYTDSSSASASEFESDDDDEESLEFEYESD